MLTNGSLEASHSLEHCHNDLTVTPLNLCFLVLSSSLSCQLGTTNVLFACTGIAVFHALFWFLLHSVEAKHFHDSNVINSNLYILSHTQFHLLCHWLDTTNTTNWICSHGSLCLGVQWSMALPHHQLQLWTLSHKLVHMPKVSPNK